MMHPKKISSASKLENSALPLALCLAKTRKLADGTLLSGRTVEDHCKIVAAVAKALLKRMPSHLRTLFPDKSENLPCTHDVGKICPTFQEKLYRAVTGIPHSMKELEGADPSLEKLWGGHSSVSLAALNGCHVPKHIAEIVGRHHGFSPCPEPSQSQKFGGIAWQARREELLKLLLATQDPGSPDNWPKITSTAMEDLLTGFTIVSDWIGSGNRFDDPQETWESLIDDVIDAAGYIPFSIKKGLRFKEIFSFAPLKTQCCFFEAVNAPGVYILEAPMGLGKTEAALYAAYKLLEQGLSSGIYFALPTQLTSNRIHKRLDAFLQKILIDPQHALLLHGKAWLSRFLNQEMGVEGAPNQSWFNSKKKGLLAPFAAGTIDQALLAAMNVRHNSVRAFGLAGKTVILDEVHSYDAYTGTLMDGLISLLRHYRCSVIILSATLTASRRASFTGQPTQNNAYPLVSASPAPSVNTSSSELQEIACPPPLEKTYFLHHCPDDEAGMEEILLRAEQGQQTLWIENTVAEAQERFRMLSARASSMDIETGLVHSRFTPEDRESNEGYWTSLYGKNSPDRNKKGRILVGTQVLEQSLDIDADFLVTRFCPTDMLFQRMGRLWRHENTRPVEARREVWMLHPAIQEAANNLCLFGKSYYVYSPYVLFRSLEVWENRNAVVLPSDIRGMLEATYEERIEQNEILLSAFHTLEQERANLQRLARKGLSTDTQPSDDEVFTRFNQRKEIDVLLLRFIDRKEKSVVLANGKKISLTNPDEKIWSDKQAIAAMLTCNCVRVAEHLAPPPTSQEILTIFSPWIYCGTKPDNFLRIAVIHNDNRLYDCFNNMFQKELRYAKEFGYMADAKN